MNYDTTTWENIIQQLTINHQVTQGEGKEQHKLFFVVFQQGLMHVVLYSTLQVVPLKNRAQLLDDVFTLGRFMLIILIFFLNTVWNFLVTEHFFSSRDVL